MFGYIMPEKPELKIKEFDIYKSYYCGVCKSIGKRHGQQNRVSLTYDATFLALLFCSLIDIKTSINKENCFVHPLKKSFVSRNEIIDYASDINVILAYNNLKDKWKDDKSVIAASGITTMRKAYKKLTKIYPEKCSVIEKRLEELAILEKNRCSSMDLAAEPFAKLMEDVLDYDKLDDNTRKILRWMGFNLGKWIYLIDAYDDLEEDVKSKSYNPLVLQFKYSGNDIGEFQKSIKNDVEFVLLYCLSEAAKAFELLNAKENKEILENIIYMGMLRKTERILCRRSCKNHEQSI
jgi:hypothetical protein